MGKFIGCLLDTGIGVSQCLIIEGLGVTEHEKLEYQGKIYVTHQWSYPVNQGEIYG